MSNSNDLVDILSDLVIAVWHLLDNSEMSGPINDPVITVWEPDFNEVSRIMDELEALPSGSVNDLSVGELVMANLALLKKGE